MLRITVIMPLMLLVLFGSAINNSVKDIKLFDQSGDRMSHGLLAEMEIPSCPQRWAGPAWAERQ